MNTVFIDGRAGTTGLRIYERLGEREDINLILLSDSERKNDKIRKEALNSCDIAFLCLPDAAAEEAVKMAENENVIIIDTSTAHRTNPQWAYGFPELSEAHLQKIKNSKRIAAPGCHASGFTALVYPLIESGIIPESTLLTCHSITGYSGGGKKMISEYEGGERNVLFDSPRQYAITQSHKHLKEMRAVTGISHFPVFCPIVSNFYSGMTVTVPLFSEQLKSGGSVNDIKNIYAEKYSSNIVHYRENADEEGFLAANKLSGSDSMEISVYGNSERILLVARYDNLGKGASGAAVECMNAVLGCDLNKSLVLRKG